MLCAWGTVAVVITMTLTAPGCRAHDLMAE
jgi:metal-sulfur cluster biosynthetic enzyme